MSPGVRDVLSIYTFASPRVDPLDFVASFDSPVNNSFRIWNVLDVVPQVPPFPYIHVSGLGDAIVQTEQQLSMLVFAPACEHALTSYQWLLDPTGFSLPPACNQTAFPVSVPRTSTTMPQPTAPESARELRKAMCGRM